jgi:hypothetical protein
MFEVIFRPMSRGPFEGTFYLWAESSTSSAPAATKLMRTESHDMGAEEEDNSNNDHDDKVESGAGDAKKRKTELSSPHRYRLEVIVTAQVLSASSLRRLTSNLDTARTAVVVSRY